MSLLLVTHGTIVNGTIINVTSIKVTSVNGAAAREEGCHRADARRADIRLRKRCGARVNDDPWRRRTDRVIDAAGEPALPDSIDDPARFGAVGAEPGDEVATDPVRTAPSRRN